ncbi:MAG: TIGR01777 family oxidoreductase [Chitinophagaceae bacterium]
MSTVLITGGTGLIGKALSHFLMEKNFQVIILTRNPKPPPQTAESGPLRYCWWDPDHQEIDPLAIADTETIIHLAGAGVADHRWTAHRKKEILESRIKGGLLLLEALKKYPNRVKTVMSASAIGYYGASSDRPFVEADGWSTDFLGTTCSLWEHQMEPIRELGKRVFILRFGIILSKEGGVLPALTRPLSMGIAPVLGSGNQWMSWIHMEDVCRIIHLGITRETINGIYNAVAPHPVAFRNLVLTLAGIRRGKQFLPLRVPNFLLKMMLGERSEEILKSCRVSSQKLLQTGYSFCHPVLMEALEDLYQTK